MLFFRTPALCKEFLGASPKGEWWFTHLNGTEAVKNTHHEERRHQILQLWLLPKTLAQAPMQQSWADPSFYKSVTNCLADLALRGLPFPTVMHCW